MRLGLPDGQICLCRNLSGPTVVVPKCQYVSMEKPRGFPWSLVSTVMLEGWGWLCLMGCPRDTSPKTSAVFFFYQKPWVPPHPTPPPTACIVLAFRVAVPLALRPHPVRAHWAGFFVNIKKDGAPSCLERDRGRQGPPLTLIPQPLSISTLDSKVTTGNLRVGSAHGEGLGVTCPKVILAVFMFASS